MNGLSDTILIVDDNEDDVFALRRALKKAKIFNPQQIVSHGREAVDYLSGAGAYADRVQFPLPFLVFLDLNTPLLNGFDVLAWVHRQPPLRQLMVVILTGSVAERDDHRASSLGATLYLTKPPTAADLEQLIQSQKENWPPSNGPVPATNLNP